MSDIKEDLKELKQDVKEIRHEIKETHQQLSRYNTLLEEHIKRTHLVEMRLEPVEDHVKFLQKLIRIGAWAIATIIALVSLWVRRG